jgi:hypothetical protein
MDDDTKKHGENVSTGLLSPSISRHREGTITRSHTGIYRLKTDGTISPSISRNLKKAIMDNQLVIKFIVYLSAYFYLAEGASPLWRSVVTNHYPPAGGKGARCEAGSEARLTGRAGKPEAKS